MEVDSSFMTDAVVYYNIPAVAPRSDKRPTLPSLTPPTKCLRGASNCPPSSVTNSSNMNPEKAEVGVPLERKSKLRSSFYTWFKRKRRSRSPNASAPPRGFVTETLSSPVTSDFYPSLSAKRTAESVSSGATDGDDIADDTYVKVVGGVSYVRKEEPEYKNVPLETVDPFASKVSHWQKQARWLSGRRLERKHRKTTDDESIDIGIIFCEEDSTEWAEFLEKDLGNLLSSNSGHPVPKIQMLKLENYAAAKCELVVQENLFKTAKVQIAIISPSMVALLSSISDLKLDRLFNPKRVIALMLKVTSLQMYDNATLSSTFCSFEEWIHLDVKDRNADFVCSVRAQVLQLLIGCNIYNGFSVTTNFSLCPRKVSKPSSQVYIHLKTLTTATTSIVVTLGSRHEDLRDIGGVNVTYHNPYTLSFTVPEKYLKPTSCFLYVYLSVEGKKLGWRELKCEGSLEVLVTALETVCDPIEMMTQALGISKIQGSLDSVLASRLRRNMPLHLLTDQDENDLMSESHLPTSLHFGAHFGLTEFCLALIQVPGSRQTITCRNFNGDTPAVLALKAGFIDLAKMLENYAFNSVTEEMNSALHLEESACSYPCCLHAPDCQHPPPVPSRASTPEASFVHPGIRKGSFCNPKSEDRLDIRKSEDCCSLQNSEGSFSLQTSDSSFGPLTPDGGFSLRKSEGCFCPRSFESDSDRRLANNDLDYSYQNNSMDEDPSFGTYVDMKQNSQTPERKIGSPFPCL